MEDKQQRMTQKMREILQEGYLHLRVKGYTVSEELDARTCRIACELSAPGDEERMTVEGEGVGMIDALFSALKTRLATDYPSLHTIKFSQFGIRGLMEGGVQGAGTTAQAEATVGIMNSEGREFIFTARAASMSQAGIQATIQATEYFVNSERTFVKLHEILEHYRRERREELVQKYTSLMMEVVENTSYSEVVERLRNQIQ